MGFSKVKPFTQASEICERVLVHDNIHDVFEDLVLQHVVCFMWWIVHIAIDSAIYGICCRVESS